MPYYFARELHPDADILLVMAWCDAIMPSPKSFATLWKSLTSGNVPFEKTLPIY